MVSVSTPAPEADVGFHLQTWHAFMQFMKRGVVTCVVVFLIVAWLAGWI